MSDRRRRKIVEFPPEEQLDEDCALHSEVVQIFDELHDQRSNHRTPARDGTSRVHEYDAPNLWRPEWAKRVEKLRKKKK